MTIVRAVSYLKLTLNTLNEDPDLLSEFRLNAVISLLGSTLNEIMNIDYEHYKYTSAKFKVKTVNVLTKITQRLLVYKDRTDRAEPLLDRISGIQELVQNLSIREESSIKIELKIALFCDLDCWDHNGAILSLVYNSFQSKFPFITTRSLLCGAEIDDPTYDWSYLFISGFHHMIASTLDEWEVFQEFNDGKEGDFLVFLPKAFCPGAKGVDKLRALDFVADGVSLQPASINGMFKPTKEKGTFERLLNLFSPSPMIEKLFYLGGHGSDDAVASFQTEHYLQLLEFLKFQKCKGVMISSCCAGGESSFLTIGCDSIRPKHTWEMIPTHSRPYVIVIRSIGGMSVVAEGGTETDIQKNMDDFAEFVEKGTATIASFRKRINKIEEGSSKVANISMQICFSHPGGVPVGFRLVGEGARAFSITYNFVKQKELEAKMLLQQGGIAPCYDVTVENEQLICIHPMIANLSINIHSPVPILLSMMPGNASHMIRTLHLQTRSFEEFINENTLFYIKGGEQNHKCFLIGEVNINGRCYQQVVLYLNPQQSRCCYFENGKIYNFDGVKGNEMSFFYYVQVFKTAILKAEPTQQAINASSGGHENYQQFFEVVKGSAFWGKRFCKMKKATALVNMLVKYDEIYQCVAAIEEGDKQLVLFELLKLGYYQIALDLFVCEGFEPNIIDLEGKPLIFYAFECHFYDLFQTLLESGVDINVKNPIKNGDSLLHYACNMAVSNSDFRYLHLLLEFPQASEQLNMNILNNDGLSPIFYALYYPKVLHVLRQYGATINTTNTKGKSILALSIECQSDHLTDVLLAEGADPNVGTTSALVAAVHYNQLETTKKIIAVGGKPFQKDSSGKIPFVEAAAWSSFEVFDYLLNLDECQVNVEDDQGINALIRVLMPGNEAKMEALRNKGARLPPKPSDTARQLFSDYLFRLKRLGDYDHFLKLMEWNSPCPVPFRSLINQFFEIVRGEQS